MYLLFVKISADYYFTCPTNYFAQKFAEHGHNVYYYHFTQVSHSKWTDKLINGLSNNAGLIDE